MSKALRALPVLALFLVPFAFSDSKVLSDAAIEDKMALIGLAANTLRLPAGSDARSRANTLFRKVTLKYLSDLNMNSALQGYKDVIRIDPTYGSAWLNAERFMEFSNQWDTAARYADALLKYAPGSDEADMLRKGERARLAKLSNLPTSERKKQEYDEVTHLAKVRMQAGYMKEAAIVCNFAMRVDPTRLEAWALMTAALKAQGRVDQANKILDIGIAESPEEVRNELRAIKEALKPASRSVAEKESATNNYVKALKQDAIWGHSVRKDFGERIAVTCSAYAPSDYPDCFSKFVQSTVVPKTLTTTGSILTLAVGTMVIVKAKKVAAENSSPEMKSKLSLQYGVDAAELSLTMIEKIQSSQKSRKILPAGPEADVMTFIANNIDDGFQVEALDKVKQMIAKMASTSCLIQGTCPSLASREKALESRYWAAESRAPKNYNPLTDSELKDAAQKANISPETEAMVLRTVFSSDSSP